MSRIDYRAISTRIQTVLQADQELLYGIPVAVEEELPFGQLENGWLGIFMTSRSLVDAQPLAIGRSARVRVYLSIWCFGYNIGDQAGAYLQRDELISKVEEVLMKNRDLSDVAEIVSVGGGQFINARDEEDFYVAAGSVDIEVDVVGRV